MNTKNVKNAFPALSTKNPIIYLDSSATTQMCNAAIESLQKTSTHICSNVHRGVHAGIDDSTLQYENARTEIQKFINAESASEILFTKNATESLNMIVQTWGKKNLTKGDTVALSIAEHHSNIVPWLQLQAEIQFTIQWIHITENFELDIHELQSWLHTGTVKCVSITGLSNVLGLQTDYANIVSLCHSVGAICVIDATQLVTHEIIDVQNIDCDFLVFSGHKLYGPTGIGVLYGKKEILENLPPFLGGGMMIRSVTTTDFIAAEIPHRFEAGTPPIREAIALGTTVTWLQTTDRMAIHAYETKLLQQMVAYLHTMPAIHVLQKTHTPKGCISFYSEKLHAHDIADILSHNNIYVRAGHHCAMPLHTALRIPASVRISVGMYTCESDIQKCIACISDIFSRI